MKKLAFVLVLLAVCLLGISIIHRQGSGLSQSGGGAAGSQHPSLMVYCGAGLKKPVAAIAEQYRHETGVEIQLQFGGTGTLLSQIQVAKMGDLFIAADEGTVAVARERGVIREAIPLVRQYPVIAVVEGNPKSIRGFGDLLREDVRVALANPEAASIGKSTRAAAGDDWEKLKQKAVVMKPTVTELAADLSLKAVDAAVIWNSTAPQFKGIEAIEIPRFTKQAEHVSATVLEHSSEPTAALKFARYLAAPEKGGAIFKEHKFEPVEGDAWAARPEMILYSGAVNRPAVEKRLNEFAAREGARLTTVFNGCGILCATMKTMDDSANPQYPDAYYACDLCFVPPVAKEFPESVLLTETDIGIAVQKGNPMEIKSLADLAGKKLRLGICNAEQSTLGFMTRGMLKSSALLEGIRRNVAVEVPTADFLINQMRAGALDAAIVYRVNYQLQQKHLDFIRIKHEGARAVQPFSVRRDSPNRQLAGRLLDYLKAHRKDFTDSGFIWRGDEPAIKSSDIEVPPWLKSESAKTD